VALRAVSRNALGGRGLRPRRLRRPHAHPPRRLSGAEDARRLRLDGPTGGGEAARPAPSAADLDAQEWVSRLEAAQDRNQLEQELRRLERYHLLIVDEVGYLPLERQAANLLFALVSRRYERGSIAVTSNRGFEQWGEILGDAMVAAALIDRLVHHATMITLKGKSYRLRERGTGTAPAAQAPSLRDSA
jgi:IstB-like ATP binding protein